MTTTPTSGAADLPEALRVPLDSLHADAGYLCGRLLNGSLTQEQVVESIRRRIDAAKLAALTAQAISAEPAGAGYAELRSSMCYIAAFDPDEVEGMSKERLEGRVRSIINVARSAVASHGQAPARATPLEFTKEWCMAAAKAEEDSGADISAGVPFSPQAAQQAPAAPPECKTEAERTAFAFGWFKALEQQRGQATAQPMLLDDERGYTLEPLYKQTSSPQAAQQAPAGAAERLVQRMEDWTDARYIAELENVVRLLRRELEKLHRVREVLSDCSAGQPCSTCPNKKACQRGCIRQEEFVSTEYHARQVAAPAAPSTPASGGWISVKDQLPPCRDDQDYIGINSAGFAGIFNAIADIAGNVYCMMETAEDSVSIMSDLSIWKPFNRPLPASPTIEGESNV